WLWDALLFARQYYTYWGPAPAVLLAAAKVVFGVGAVGDQYLTLAFAIGLLAAGAAVICAIAPWFRRTARSPSCLLAIAVFGFANPLPYTLARGAVYEAAITAGQFFL